MKPPTEPSTTARDQARPRGIRRDQTDRLHPGEEHPHGRRERPQVVNMRKLPS
ncbi:hypothetical protein FHX76_002637 [Lysinibacter cavernae]|uniref:Uncharacterized protein n=1 Tax=Lysinibacter cavernae TaxID=1640652 RepID=A0A7X5TTL0_9MICO|nr:hypothetical protein [Lysinibacter cavernae]